MKQGTRIGTLELLNVDCGYFEDFRMIGEQNLGEENCALKEVNVDRLPKDEKEKLFIILKQFEDVFSKSRMDIGHTHLITHKMDTGNALPIASAPRRIPVALEEKVDRLIDDLLSNDIIQPSESPWNAPIVIVAKKTGDIRMCVDYSRSNAVTK